VHAYVCAYARALKFWRVSLQVLHTLDRIENCTTFAEFVKVFSEFGNEMVDLAHLSGDRQHVSKPLEGLTVWSDLV